MSEERKAFEEWFGAPVPLQRNTDGDYVYMEAHRSWVVWQAALSTYANKMYEGQLLWEREEALRVGSIVSRQAEEIEQLNARITELLKDGSTKYTVAAYRYTTPCGEFYTDNKREFFNDPAVEEWETLYRLKGEK